MTCRVKCSISAWAASWLAHEASLSSSKKRAIVSGIDTKNQANLAPLFGVVPNWREGLPEVRRHGGRGRVRVGECFEFINNAGWQLPITFCLERLFFSVGRPRKKPTNLLCLSVLFCESKLICEGLGGLPKFGKNLKIIDNLQQKNEKIIKRSKSTQ